MMRTKVILTAISVLFFLSSTTHAQTNVLLDYNGHFDHYEQQVDLPEIPYHSSGKFEALEPVTDQETYEKLFNPREHDRLPEINFQVYELHPVEICPQCLHGCEAYGTPAHRNQCHRNRCGDELHWFLFRKTK